jgi:hypothetical protein
MKQVEVELTDLIGKNPQALWISPSGEDLYLVCDGAIYLFQTDEDCCSESWWADICSPQQLLEGDTITMIEEIPLPDPEDERSKQEVDFAYGYALKTNRGTCTFIYRNSSNGYYGGSCNIYAVEEVPEECIKVEPYPYRDWRAADWRDEEAA